MLLLKLLLLNLPPPEPPPPKLSPPKLRPLLKLPLELPLPLELTNDSLRFFPLRAVREKANPDLLTDDSAGGGARPKASPSRASPDKTGVSSRVGSGRATGGTTLQPGPIISETAPAREEEVEAEEGANTAATFVGRRRLTGVSTNPGWGCWGLGEGDGVGGVVPEWTTADAAAGEAGEKTLFV